MAEKTEDQIQREKEAVAKMVGAKSAMEAALQRIATLESYGNKVTLLARELGRFIGPDARVSSHYSSNSSTGAYQGETKFVSADILLQQINRIQTEIFEKA